MTRRSETINTIHGELTDFARRARSSSRQALPELSFAAYTLLRHVQARGGCRASELVGHFGLEKSTVSRQVADLSAAGLLEREPDPSDSRAVLLKLSGQGDAALARADRVLRAAVSERLADWSDAELEQFAALLARYNAEE